MVEQDIINEFDKIYYDTYNDVLRYVVCNCSNIDDVNDIVQNIYMSVLNKINKNDSNIINKNYILGIAKHKVKDYYGFKYKNKIISFFSINEDKNLIEDIPSEIDIQQEIINKFDIEKVWEFLKTKKVMVSKVFYLYYYLNETIKDISKELNITESNVKHYLYRTLKELNSYLREGDKNE